MTMRWLQFTLLAAMLLSLGGASAQPVPEYDLKAAFVYNFAVFTDWPSEVAFESGMLNICVNSNSALRQPLLNLGYKQVKGRKVAVRSLSAMEDIRNCHVVFVGSADRDRWSQIRKSIAGASVLTVSDEEEIAHDGVIISLSSEASRVVFDIDTRLARQARLAISSKLLRLARSVQ
jgi:hypothetical protein